jgi:hypothetical protein
VNTFRVDDETGTDQERLTKAHAKARAAIPSTVLLPDYELRLTNYFNWRAGVTIDVEGADSGFFLDYPGAVAPLGSVQAPAGLRIQDNPLTTGYLTTLTGFTIRARPEGYYRLIQAISVPGLNINGVRFGVCGKSFIEASNCPGIRINNIVGPYGGDNSWDRASGKYKVSLIACNDFLIDSPVLGTPAHDHNQSFITINGGNGSVINPTCYGTQTYALNAHGGGADVVFEGGSLAPGPSAFYGAVLLGNEYYGPDTGTLRGITMQGTGRFLQLRAGSEATLEGNNVPACNELVGFGPGGGAAHIKG